MSGQFDRSAQYSQFEIGTVIHALFNPDNRKWLPLNGQDVYVGQWPDFAAKFQQCGVFTSTSRPPLNSAPAASVIAADDTNFLVPGAAGTSALQASADGASWSTSATWAASTAFASIIKAGSRFIAAPSAGESVPYVANIDQTAANIVAKSNWTATTSGTTTTLNKGLAYSSGLGRAVLCKNGSLATANGLFYMNDAGTTFVACSGGSTADRKALVFTGQKFIAFTATNLYQISSDGQTFTDATLPYDVTGVYAAESDQKGTVVASVSVMTRSGDGVYAILTSYNHGATWSLVEYPDVKPANVQTFSYVNGKFFGTRIAASNVPNSALVSKAATCWTVEPIQMRGVLLGTYQYAVGYKAGVYLLCGAGGTSAITATEDTSQFRVPSLEVINSGSSTALSLPLFVRAKR